MPTRPYTVSLFSITVPAISYFTNSSLYLPFAELAAIMLPPAIPGPIAYPIGTEFDAPLPDEVVSFDGVSNR